MIYIDCYTVAEALAVAAQVIVSVYYSTVMSRLVICQELVVYF